MTLVVVKRVLSLALLIAVVGVVERLIFKSQSFGGGGVPVQKVLATNDSVRGRESSTTKRRERTESVPPRIVSARNKTEHSSDGEADYCYITDYKRSQALHQRWDFPQGSVDVYPMGKATVGFSITINMSLSKIDAIEAFGIERLSRVVPYRMKTPNGFHSPTFEDLLGCRDDQKPQGTAFMGVQNFHCPNLWHALAVQQSTWQLMQSMELSPKDVDAVFVNYFTEKGTLASKQLSFNTSKRAMRSHDVAWPLFVRQPRPPPFIENQNSCFRQLFWVQASHGNNVGPLWELLGKDLDGCSKTNSSLFQRVHEYQRQLLAVVQGRLQKHGFKDDSNPSQLVVCYMSREVRRPPRSRYFTDEFAPRFEKALDQWAQQKNESIVFHRLLFEEGVPPFEDQISRVRQCSILFGPHGAGLAHMLWIEKRPSLILEFSEKTGPTRRTSCRAYFGHMSSLLGHQYLCFNRLNASGVTSELSADGKYNINSMNIGLFLEQLDHSLELVKAATKTNSF